MKSLLRTKYIAILFTLIVFIIASAALLIQAQNKVAGESIYNDLYVCSMHPWEASEGPGSCEICSMNLSKVEGHKPGTPLPEVDGLYVSPDDPFFVHEGQGSDPKTGSELISIKNSPYYQPQKSSEISDDHGNDSEAHSQHAAAEAQATDLWTCGMHPDVIQDEPGICPICHMDLIPLKASTAAGDGAVVQIDPVTLQSIGVVTENVEHRDLSRQIRSNGTIEAAEDLQVRVNARVSGWVEKLYVARTGDPVKKGEPLLEIYSPELVSAQEEFLLALQSAEALENSGLTQASFSVKDLIAAAKRRLELWNISEAQITKLEQTRQVRRTLTLVSPIGGIVLHKNVIEGSAVKPGLDLFLIADLSRVWLQGQIYEFELPWIDVGDRVEVSSPYDPNLTIQGHLEYIYPTLDIKNRSVQARVSLPNPNLALKPGMYVDMRIFSSPKKKATSVSKAAVIRSGERDIVFVALGDGQFEPRQVHVGLETDRFYEIPHGLEIGEKVVTSAQFLLDSEAKLQEAIQRRLALRKNNLDNTAANEDDVAADHSGHIR